jgi:hypothetical protein
MSEVTQEEMEALVPKKIAFVIDGEVIDILHTDERLASIFLSQPEIVDVTSEDGSGAITQVGASYDKETGIFTSPEAQNLPSLLGL